MIIAARSRADRGRNKNGPAMASAPGAGRFRRTQREGHGRFRYLLLSSRLKSKSQTHTLATRGNSPLLFGSGHMKESDGLPGAAAYQNGLPQSNRSVILAASPTARRGLPKQ